MIGHMQARPTRLRQPTLPELLGREPRCNDSTADQSEIVNRPYAIYTS
jgi:hypothetical protein